MTAPAPDGPPQVLAEFAPAPPKPWLHPWIGELHLTISRRKLSAVRALAILSLQILAGAAVVAWLIYESRRPLDEALAHGLRALAAAPLWTCGLCTALSAYAVRRRLAAVRAYLRSGWWAAQPISPAATARTLGALAVACALAGSLLLTAMALLLRGLLAAQAEDAKLTTVYALSTAGLYCGAAVGALWIGKKNALNRSVRSLRIAADARIPWPLRRHRLAGLAEWQRREAQLQWRAGGNFWMLGIVLVGLPSGISSISAAGFVLLAVAAIWYSVVLRASLHVAQAALALMRSTPMTAAQGRGALLIYPGVAAVLALSLCMAGALLLGYVGIGLLAAAAILGLLSLRPLLIFLLALRRAQHS